jgi:hypothetical protein
MAVVAVTTTTVKPDRWEDFLADVRKVKAVMDKCGARNVRVLAGLVAGEATGTATFLYEADDFAGYGGIYDKFLADPDGLALIQSTGASTSPVNGFQSTLWVDVPL